MGSNVVPGFNPVFLAADETVLGTAVAPADVATYAAQAIATIECDLGDAQSPAVRPKQDRGLGRGMQDGFVSGRYPPVPWSVKTSMKTRSAIDAVPRELALWKSTGLGRTVNGSTSYVLAPTATPVESTDLVTQTFTRILGRSPGEMEYERLLGCFADTVKLEGGDKEVEATFSGMGQQKLTGTALASVTMASGVSTTITVTAAESYAFMPGYYICESEVVLVGAVTYGGTTINVTRAQLGTSGVSHAAKPLYPYIPAGVAYAGSPISEAATTTATLYGITVPVLKWGVTIKTGLSASPGETGSAYFQKVITKRFDVEATFDLLLKGDDVRLFNRARERTANAVTLVQGSAVGGVITIGLPYTELVAPAAKDSANDEVTVSCSLRVRDDTAGNNAFSLTLT